MTADAQNFLGNLQQKEQGKGHVTVSQSADIDALVNGTAQQKKQTNTQQSAKQSQQTAAKPTQQKTATQQSQTAKAQSQQSDKTKPATTAKPAATQQKNSQDVTPKEHKDNSTTTPPASTEQRESVQVEQPEKSTTSGKQMRLAKPVIANDVPSTTVDTRKKVMSRSYKTQGYRIQVYSGGNTRKDRQAAENAGTKMKSYFPSEPVYVHFYSPSWKCRMGNYTSVDIARKVLAQVKALGYKQAVIVKGPISVQY